MVPESPTKTGHFEYQQKSLDCEAEQWTAQECFELDWDERVRLYVPFFGVDESLDRIRDLACAREVRVDEQQTAEMDDSDGTPHDGCTTLQVGAAEPEVAKRQRDCTLEDEQEQTEPAREVE